MVARVGAVVAETLRERTLAIYRAAHRWSWERGLVLADTKFEFGHVDGALTLIDEVLSPDSSRYWDRHEYQNGRLLSFDKQFVRDWLDRSGWNHEPPAPPLPEDVVQLTRERYLEAMHRLTGEQG
jgi:phosphoribosylaminoimidazole-succinocarboxamide synthase